MSDMSIWTEAQAGPASYADGGIPVTTSLASVEACTVVVSAPGANLGQVEFDIALNSPGAGQVTIKVMRKVYRKLTAITEPIEVPANIAVRTTSGGTYLVVNHNHSIAHDHAAATSGTPTAAGGGSTLGVGGIALTTHTHSFDPPNFTGNSGIESGHTHTWDNIYEHQHSVTNTETDVNVTELTAGTDISDATLNLFVVGTV